MEDVEKEIKKDIEEDFISVASDLLTSPAFGSGGAERK